MVSDMQLESVPTSTERIRKEPRLPMRVTVQFRKGLTKVKVDLLDISPNGAKISAINVLRPGEIIWLKIPDLAALEAKVVWTEEFVIGCEFVTPLHPSVFEGFVQRH